MNRSFGPDATGPPTSSVPWVARDLGVPQSDSVNMAVISPTKDVFSNVPDPRGDLTVRNKLLCVQG